MPNNIESPFSGNIPIQAALNELRLRLLDLTGRNKLIHFTHRPGSSLQFVHSVIDGTFRRLTEQNARVAITPLPEPDRSDWVNKNGRLVRPDPKEFAELLGINTSYTLDFGGARTPQRQGGQAIAVVLQTLFFVAELGKHCRKLEREAKLAIEETGANKLYLVAGFLEFSEAPNSEKLYMAPLLCIPVSLSRSDEGPYSTFFLNHTGDEITDNLSLREKLKRDFGFNLPEYDSETDSSAENYLKTISDALETNPNWRVHRMMTLTLLSFTNMLLVRDLDPAKWGQGGAFNSLVEHPLIKQIFEGNPAGGEAQYAQEYLIDDHPNGDLPLIYDADSSQHSALIDVLEGHNRVIEGPPGTGKSQTITNLIAAGLQAGKKILFVAEKLAALEVVKSRLTRADLAPFVLELHSNKTNKKHLLEDIANRISLPIPNAENLPDLLQRLEEKRRNLKAYADLMNTQIGNDLNLTLHQIMWRAERHRMQASNSAQAVQNIDYFSASRTNLVQFAEICDCLRHLAAQLGLIGTYGPEHPLWGFFPQELSPEQDLIVQRVLRDYAAKFAEFARFSKKLTDRLGGSDINMSAQGSMSLLSVLANLVPGDPLNVDFALLPSLFSSDDPQGHRGLGVLQDIKDRIERIAFLEATIRTHLLDRRSAPEKLLESTNKCLQALSVLGMESLNRTALDDAVNILQGASTASQESLGRLKSIADMVGLRFEGSQSDIQAVEAVVSVAASVREDLLDFRHEGLRQPSAVAKLSAAKTELDKNIDKAQVLKSIFYMDVLPSETEIYEAVQTLREGDAWYRIFQGHWRKALRVHKRLEKNKGKKNANDRLRDLELLLTAQNARANWNADIELQTVSGIHFRGEQTPLDQLYELAQWAEESRVTLESSDVHSAVFDPYKVDRSVIVRLSNQKEIIDKSMQAFSRLDSAIKELLNRAMPRVLNSLNSPLWNIRLATLDPHIKNIKLVSAFLAKVFRVSTSIESGLVAVNASRDLPQLEQTLLAYQDARDLLVDRFQGRNTNLEAAFAAHAYGTLVKKANLPKSIEDILISDGCVENHTLLIDYIERINMGWKATIDFERAMKSLGEFNLADWADSSNKPTSEYVQQLVVKTQHAADNLGMLLAWTQYVATRTKAIFLRLDGFVVGVENGDIKGDKLEHAFIYRFYAAIARGVFDSVPALKQFNGVRHSAVRQEYADLDKEIIRLRGKQVAISCSRRSYPPVGRHGARVNEKTEMNLLNHLIPQQRPRVPVRQIMRRAGKAIQELKPCFMMGPQSVAQFLEPGGLHFDIIVMDEASQLRPEQAIGAIARGSQLVVVGDPNQLPPTSFFSRMVIADGDDQSMGSLATTDAESILDVCISHFKPVRTLRWHYRSRHESLIAFSNHHFYRGNLVVFPSPFPRGKSLGLSYQHVADGIYGNQVNHAEARRVVDAAVEHILLRPDDSLGIVTLNIKQRDLLAEMLDTRLFHLPQASDFKEKWEKEGMGLFIKNLENVQGDERDCIFISTTFGKAEGVDVVRQNFGPISREGGWRRLNVLFTRARKSVVVFSSMLPEDIVSDNRTPEGTRALRNYLEFARTGVLPMDHETGLPPDSDFEIAVMDLLRNKGYEVTPQLGVAGFRIDIAVKHPLHLSGYLAAIECDGASYHSGVSVRDRDRIRQEILESLGWRGRIWRIWSTDWFRNPIAEMDRMLQFLNGLCEEPVPSEYVVAEDAQVPEVFIPAHASRQLELFTEEDEATEELLFDEDEDLETKVGDLVGYAPLDAPDIIIYVQLTTRQTNPEMGLVAGTTPLGSILMGVTVGETVVLRVPGKDPRSFMVKSIKRQAVRSDPTVIAP